MTFTASPVQGSIQTIPATNQDALNNASTSSVDKAAFSNLLSDITQDSTQTPAATGVTVSTATPVAEGSTTGEGTISLDAFLETALSLGTPLVLTPEAGTLAPVTTLTITNDVTGIDTIPTVSEILLLDGSNLGNEAGLLEKITAKINDLQAKNPTAGVLFNLTPEQLTRLQQEITAAQGTGQSIETPEGFELFFISVVPTEIAKTGADIEAIQTLPFVQKQNTPAGDAQTPSSLNDLVQDVDARNFDDLLNIRSAGDKFSALLKNAAALKGDKGDNAGTQKTDINTNNNAAPTDFAAARAEAKTQAANIQAGGAAPQTTPLGALEGLPLPEGDVLAALGIDGDLLNSLGTSSSTPAFQVTGTTDFTNVTTQARHAALPHPGTSAVANVLKQGQTAEGTQRLIIRLDPPELGRVEVRLEFASDKKVKAVIMSEKPEAHMMLQRDAQILERALQDSGLDADGSSLEFSLADDGSDFGQDGSHDGSRNKANGGENDDLDLIETTMNWHVDPETGHMHYNILV